MNFSSISLDQNKILCILVFCYSFLFCVYLLFRIFCVHILCFRKKMKADPSADSSKTFTVNQEVSIVDVRVIFLELMLAA